MTGATLRKLRKAAGLSVAELAEEIGVDEYTVWRWEAGKDPIIPRRAAELREVLR